MVIYFVAFDKNSGVTLYFSQWAIALKNNGVKFKAIIVDKEQEKGLIKKISDEGIDIEVLSCVEDLRYYKFQSGDIIHCQGFKQLSHLVFNRKTSRVNLDIILTFHAFRHLSKIRVLYTNLYSFYCNMFKDVTFHYLSKKAYIEFQQFNLFNKNKINHYFFPMGIDFEEYIHPMPVGNMLVEFGYNSAKKNMICLADFHKGKNQMKLIRSLTSLIKEHDINLWLFGRGVEYEKTKSYVLNNNLSEYVKLPGRVSRYLIPDILSNMNLGICVSDSETMGSCIIEPLASGIPVVSFDVGVASEIIVDFYNGFLVKTNTWEELTEKISNLLVLSEEIESDNCKKSVSHFSWGNIALNTKHMYSALLNRI